MTQDAKKLVGIENDILQSLQNAQGQILDNEEIIEQLKFSKKLALEINDRMEETAVKKE